jgi:transcriptional regulator with XRE-family HTH domain
MKKLNKDLDLIVGNNITRLRKDLGLSQEALANKLEITKRSLGTYETARNSVPIALLPVFADFFNISVENLLNQPSKNVDGRTRSARILKSLEAVEKMPESDQNLVLGMIESLQQKVG